MRNLPLFPLNTVLFPGGTIPLQVFEPRYLRLIDDCLNSDSKFGVVLIKEGKEVGGPSVPMSIGTIAKITSVKNLPNNRLLVTSIGTDRFNILEILKDDPYMVASVDVQNELGGTISRFSTSAKFFGSASLSNTYAEVSEDGLTIVSGSATSSFFGNEVMFVFCFI